MRVYSRYRNCNKRTGEDGAARFNAISPESKIMLGGGKELTIKDIINHIEKGDKFGRKIVHTQIKMLKVLTSQSQGLS